MVPELSWKTKAAAELIASALSVCGCSDPQTDHTEELDHAVYAQVPTITAEAGLPRDDSVSDVICPEFRLSEINPSAWVIRTESVDPTPRPSTPTALGCCNSASALAAMSLERSNVRPAE